MFRILALAVLALLTSAAFAAAQTDSYTIGGSVTVHGGSKAKPKPGGLAFSFDVASPNGLQAAPLKTYSIMYEGGRLNTNLLPSCPAAKLNAGATTCPKGSAIGTGTLTALIGSTGQPTTAATKCVAGLRLFAAGQGHATLLIKAVPPACPIGLTQAVDMQYVTKGDTAGLRFTVPDLLRHQIGLDISVIHAAATLKTITKTKAHKKVGYVESTGCQGSTRSMRVTFTDETGASVPVEKSLGRC